jgi:hypothetical protein
MSGNLLSSAGLSINIYLKNNSYSGDIAVRGLWSQSQVNRNKDLGSAKVGSTVAIPGTF